MLMSLLLKISIERCSALIKLDSDFTEITNL